VRLLAWVQGSLAAVNLAVGGLWLYGLALADCGGLPLLAGIGSIFIAGFLAAGGMWSLVYRAGQVEPHTSARGARPRVATAPTTRLSNKRLSS
jgi:hypothetical protein